jgi:hypothetical protein
MPENKSSADSYHLDASLGAIKSLFEGMSATQCLIEVFFSGLKALKVYPRFRQFTQHTP